jgi:hypothetical protein
MSIMFKPEMFELVLAGEKTQTRREMSDNPRSPWFRDGSRLPVIGSEVPIQRGRGVKATAAIRICESGPQELGRMTDFEAEAEGFPAGLEAFFDYWRRMHGAVDFTEEVWVLGFDLIPSQTPASSSPAAV